MGRRGPSQDQVALVSRLAVLLVVTAGFFLMHGFLAVSASADTHGAHSGVEQPVEHGVEQLTVSASPMHATSAVHLQPGAPAPPAPAEHHDLVAGCVVALVGIAVIALASLLLRRGRPGVVGPLGRAAHVVRPWVAERAPGLPPPPRIALCVIRV